MEATEVWAASELQLLVAGGAAKLVAQAGTRCIEQSYDCPATQSNEWKNQQSEPSFIMPKAARGFQVLGRCHEQRLRRVILHSS